VVRAVDGISYTVDLGETVAIVGESGSGKSVSALSVMRLIPDPPGRITHGEIRFAGRDIMRLSDAEMREVRGGEIGMVFQEPMTSLNPVLTIGRQITETLEQHRGMDPSAAQRRAIELLALVGISDAVRRLKQYPHQLSGGMRQRVGIARALVVRPAVLLMDEPLSALDAQTRELLIEDFLALWLDRRVAVLYVTHNLNEALRLADRVVVLSRRPGVVKEIVAVPIPRPERRSDAARLEIARLHDVLWRLIRNEAAVADREVSNV
jgi:oligopeptide transport system ATP-binding protein